MREATEIWVGLIEVESIEIKLVTSEASIFSRRNRQIFIILLHIRMVLHTFQQKKAFLQPSYPNKEQNASTKNKSRHRDRVG